MKEKEFTLIWKRYEPLIQALTKLLHPFVEIAVHNLKEGKIVALYHNISRRKTGEPSPLKELKVEIKDFPDFFTPYYKQNWDGRPLKCTSITLRDNKGRPIGLICINIDVSFFKDGYKLLEIFLKTKESASNPIEIFGSECELQAEKVIEQFTVEANVSLNHLNRNQKKELVQKLYKKGIFNFKNAPSFIAKKLNISRASIYNHIKQIGN